VFPLAPQAGTPYEQGERSLEQALREGGPKEMTAAAEALTEGRIDRWISSTDKAFVQIVNLLGSVKVQVDEGINYNVPGSDFQLILGKGSNTPLSGDQLLRYFRYLGTLGEEGVTAQGALLARVLETYIAKTMDEKQLETTFNKLMNTLQTDVTISDFYTRMGMLLDILASGGEFVVDVKE
jgi:anionic cell wall polymer biosynthesis LytR-Cps2A-Psr (LCP) family protein